MSTLPSRHQPPELNRRLVANAVAKLDAPAAPAGVPKRPSGRPPRLVGVLALVTGIIGLALLMGRGRSAAGVAYSKDSVVKADMVGAPTSVAQFAPVREGNSPPASMPRLPAASSPPSQLGEPAAVMKDELLAPSVPPSRRAARRRGGAAPAATEPAPACASCGASARLAPTEEEWEVVFDEAADGSVRAGGSVVNVGTRIPVSVQHAVLTGAGAAPVTLELSQDLRLRDRVVLARGTLLVGDAYATETDDRAQVLLSAVVVEGNTKTLRAVVLGEDGALGLKGKLMRKGSKAKRGAGRILGSLGSALSFGLAGSGGGLIGAASGNLVQGAGEELRQSAQGWMVSDKVVRIEPGTRGVLYLQADLELP